MGRQVWSFIFLNLKSRFVVYGIELCGRVPFAACRVAPCEWDHAAWQAYFPVSVPNSHATTLNSCWYPEVGNQRICCENISLEGEGEEGDNAGGDAGCGADPVRLYCRRGELSVVGSGVL